MAGQPASRRFEPKRRRGASNPPGGRRHRRVTGAEGGFYRVIGWQNTPL